MSRCVRSGRLGWTIPEPAMLRLAEAAHQLWCARMIDGGWRPGAAVDERARTHDALVPFELLGEDDRWAAVESVEALGLEELLADSIAYPRGDERPLGVGDMRAGRRVESTLGRGPAGSVCGRIVAWGEHPTRRRLEWVRVRWDDGSVTTHSPLELELRLVD